MSRDTALPKPGERESSALVIGLVNNMPDSALEATERQFRVLLEDAAKGRSIDLRLLALPELPRGAAARATLSARYQDVRELAGTRLDGLIVTGCEPRSERLADEPYYESLAALLEWAGSHTSSTIWSCLAAHAAVLCLDGIDRQRFDEKLFGILPCPAKVGHGLTVGLGSARRVPHSRHNDLPVAELTAKGYEILAHADGSGADFFVKRAGSLFVFLQGHPEYDRHALLREYRRDISRYLSGERTHYPHMPQYYFDAAVTQALRDFETQALARREPALSAQLPLLEQYCAPEALWRTDSVRLYANWLDLLEAEQATRLGSGATALERLGAARSRTPSVSHGS